VPGFARLQRTAYGTRSTFAATSSPGSTPRLKELEPPGATDAVDVHQEVEQEPFTAGGKLAKSGPGQQRASRRRGAGSAIRFPPASSFPPGCATRETNFLTRSSRPPKVYESSFLH
jgi:hypothetical protein